MGATLEDALRWLREAAEQAPSIRIDRQRVKPQGFGSGAVMNRWTRP